MSVGLAVPLELGGKRRRRIEVAQAEFEAVEAEVADRERRLTNEVRVLYVEALASLRELGTLEELNNLDLQTTRFVQARVNEGDTAPIELNQLRVEVDRLRSRRSLVEGRLQSTLLRLKSLTGLPPAELLRLREDIRSVFDDTQVGVLRDRDRLLTFGVSVGIPIFNRNQGGKAEAAAAIAQAQRRREFLEGGCAFRGSERLRSIRSSTCCRQHLRAGCYPTFHRERPHHPSGLPDRRL
jgi:outer membrane protein TolC